MALAIATSGAFILLVGLGTWQIHRLAWKRALIERVESRIHAPPASAPGPGQWATVTSPDYEYRRVLMRGHYLHERETLVQAATKLGAGFWVMTPFQTDDGYVVLVNRGFVPPLKRLSATRSQGQITGEITVTGLLRISEPGGGFLRANDPSTERWYSRDVAAMSAARGLTDCAPYFVDAAALEPTPAGAPIGGLTVVAFANDHLEYALTWFALASMIPVGAWMMARPERARLASHSPLV